MALPRARRAEHNPPMTGAERHSQRSVVYADDDPEMVELVRLAIRHQPDFTLVAATSDPAAITDLLRKHRPDVVILDHVLDPHTPDVTREFRQRGVVPPAQTGLGIVEYTRAALPETTIVIFTGVQGLGRAARNVGADVCIEKPDLDAVWLAIREARANR